MEKLNRVTLLDNTKRPKAPKIEGLTPAQQRQGRRLGRYHNMHRAQMDEVREAMDLLDAEAMVAKISALAMRKNYQYFGNLCGQECRMLSGHHGIEDSAIFPVLHEAGDSGLKKVVERLMAEHLVVHELIEELEARASQLINNPTAESFAETRRTFIALETCVKSHFGYEETELADALGVIDVGI